ncbi:MAG: ATP-binding protein [Acidobacteria bacterium]|nr:ATP-binding protein [Acidobacteriota bacterium]
MDAPRPLYPRSLAPALREALTDTPVVCLVGPRQSGKTTLVEHLASDRAFVSLDEHNYRRAAEDDPDGFVAGLPPDVTLDEVQRVPVLLVAVKRAVDRDRRPGRFLLTGSANPLLAPTVTDSLAGRMEIAQLHPLTESEKARRPGRFLHALLHGAFEPGIRANDDTSTTGEPTLPERLVAGGFPEPLRRTAGRARQWHRQYVRGIIERDVRDVARIRDAHELGRLLELLALHGAELFNASRLAGDLGLRRETVDHYVAVLERVFLVRRLPAWRRDPARRLITSPKVHLLDSGLAATLAGLRADDWRSDRSRMGHLLESWVVQQLVAQATWTDPDLRFWHYRDKDQVEVDVVVTRGRKTWGIEVKASGAVTRDDGRGLARLANRCQEDFVAGIVLYAGRDILPLGDPRTLAVPLSELWGR